MNLILPCAPGCCQQGGCEIARDNFERASLTGGSITWSGSGPGWSIASSSYLTCSANDVYLIANGVPAHNGGQVIQFDVHQDFSGAMDYLVNYIDQNNYERAYVAAGATTDLGVLSKVGGSESLIYYSSSGFPKQGRVIVYRWADKMAVRTVLAGQQTDASVDLGIDSDNGTGRRFYGEGFPTLNSAATVGLHSQSIGGTAQWDYFRYYNYYNGDDCPQYDGRATGCDELDQATLQCEVTFSGIIGAASPMNGTHILNLTNNELWRRIGFEVGTPGVNYVYCTISKNSSYVADLVGGLSYSGGYADSFQITSTSFGCDETPQVVALHSQPFASASVKLLL